MNKKLILLCLPLLFSCSQGQVSSENDFSISSSMISESNLSTSNSSIVISEVEESSSIEMISSASSTIESSISINNSYTSLDTSNSENTSITIESKYTLNGKIIDNKNEGVDNVEIVLKNSKNNYNTVTNELGEYVINNVSEGIYEMSFKMPSDKYKYSGGNINVTINGNNQTISVGTVVVTRDTTIWGELC